MTQEEQYKASLSRYLPPTAVDSIYHYLNSNAVHLHITRKRSSKLGDYRMPQPRHQYHEISVNGDLTPHMFLLVLLHEMAHLDTFLQYGRSVQPHGHEWQQHYSRLLRQYALQGHFPAEVGTMIEKYTAKIPLSNSLGRALERKLQQLDSPETATDDVVLNELPVGTLFRVKDRPQQLFRSLEKRRTRFRCVDVQTGIAYLVGGNAIVLPEDGGHRD